VRLFREEAAAGEVSLYLTLARHFLSKWNQDKVGRKVGYGIEKHVSNYSIS
jgi:hypothetical protein